MKAKRQRKAGFLILAVSVFILVSVSVSKASVNKEINASKEKITGNQEKLKEIRSEQEDLKNRLQELENLKSDTASYIAGLDEKQAELEESIGTREASIGALEKNIEKLAAELKECTAEQERQKEGMAIRIRYMYETSLSGTAAAVLESGSLGEMLNTAEYFRKVSEFDRQKLDEYRKAAEACRQKQAELDSELEVMNAEKESLEEQLAASEQLEKDKTAELTAFEEKISTVNKQSDLLSRDAGKLQDAIRAEEQKIAEIEAELKRQEEEERKRALAQNKKSVSKNIGDLNFLWPVPASSRVTSTFGEREAPVAGASTSHKGIDIGAASGSEVLAAESGTVVIATYSESAGNYVMISHGNGIYTVYMHLKEIGTGVNDTVKRGDTIGTVGNTGYSTGPHLHFGIRVNGEYVNPQNYVSP